MSFREIIFDCGKVWYEILKGRDCFEDWLGWEETGCEVVS
jgi:hypothetical protein